MATCRGSFSFFFPKPGMLGMVGTQERDEASVACGRVGGLLRKAA